MLLRLSVDECLKGTLYLGLKYLSKFYLKVIFLLIGFGVTNLLFIGSLA